MRVCPSCGHEDGECWRNHPRQLYTQYCHIEELELQEHELLELLLDRDPTPSEVVTRPPFIYRVSRSRHVHRMALKDYELYGFHGRIFESPRRAWRLYMEGKQKKIKEFLT